MARELLFTGPGGNRQRSKRHLVAAVLGIIAVFVAVACESKPEDRSAVINLVNETRSANGLNALEENVQLDMKADDWAVHLRSICNLEHSHLADGAPGNWLKLGENVGYGGDIAQVHDAYLNSPGHRANILDSSYTSMGAAAVWGNCDGWYRVFTVQVFMKS